MSLNFYNVSFAETKFHEKNISQRVMAWVELFMQIYYSLMYYLTFEAMACKDGALDVCFNKLAFDLLLSSNLEVRGGGKSESLMIPPLLDMIQPVAFLQKNETNALVCASTS